MVRIANADSEPLTMPQIPTANAKKPSVEAPSTIASPVSKVVMFDPPTMQAASPTTSSAAAPAW